MPGKAPSLVNTSLWQMPQACTLTRTEPGPGSGTGRSTSSRGPPGRDTWTARMFGMAQLRKRGGDRTADHEARRGLAEAARDVQRLAGHPLRVRRRQVDGRRRDVVRPADAAQRGLRFNLGAQLALVDPLRAHP